MKCLALALVLCAQLHLLHGACYGMGILPDATHCQDFVDKTWHAFGSGWRNSACQDCSCNRCCDGYVRPVSFPDDCTMEFDSKKCEYTVFKKTDPTQSCPIFGAVGKYSTPVGFPDDCMKEFDDEKCKYKVFKKTDPTQPCPIFFSVGK